MPEIEDLDPKEKDKKVSAALDAAEKLEVEPTEPFETVHQPPDAGIDEG